MLSKARLLLPQSIIEVRVKDKETTHYCKLSEKMVEYYPRIFGFMDMIM